MERLLVATAFLLSLLFVNTSIAQTFQNIPVFFRNNADNESLEDGEEIFRVRNAWLNRLKDGRYEDIKITLPSAEGDKVLELSKRAIAPPEGIKVTTASGQFFMADPGVHYFGTIKNEERSTVIIGVSPSAKMYMFMQESDGRICEIAQSKDHNGKYLFAEFKDQETMICPLSTDNHNQKQKGNNNLQKMSGCAIDDMDDANCPNETFNVNVYYELDHITYIDEGSDIQNCIDWMTDTHSIVNMIYDNIDNVSNNNQQILPLSSGIDLLFSGLFIWDHPDPYLVGTSTLEALETRADQFRQQRPTFNGDIAHLINKGILNVGGWANIVETDLSSSLCNDNSNPSLPASPHCVSYVSTLTNNQDFVYSYGTALLAHEMGHLLGGRHTHEAFWYPDSNGTHAIETVCNPNSMTNACTHTDISEFDVTIMNNGEACWGPIISQPTIEYSSPFHKQTSLTILNNLCDFQSCYEENSCSVDMDLDGVCADEDCDDSNPTMPGLVGTTCNDDNIQTINDSFVGVPGTLSCNCQGTLWSNPEDEECNLIIGGDMTFDNEFVGNAAASWYGGYNSSWAAPPQNTPDIGNAIVNGVCEKFIGLFGAATNGVVQTIEGLVIPLSHPIPCNTGTIRFSFDYSFVGDNADNINGNLLCIQGSQGNEPIQFMPTCGNNINPLATDLIQTAPRDQLSSIVGNTQLYFGNCSDESLNFTHIDLTLENNTDLNLNFLYITLNINNLDWNGEHEVFIDNIEVEMLPNSYASIDVEHSVCAIEEIVYSPFCDDYEIQSFDGQYWTTVDQSLYGVFLTENGLDEMGRKIFRDQLNFTPSDCRQYRVIQNCPPFSSESYCFGSGMEIPFDCEANDLSVNLLQSPQGDICIGENVILFDPNYNEQTGAGFWPSIWSTGDVTDVAQLNDVTELIPDSYPYSVTVTDPETGCSGTDEIEVVFVDCPPPACNAECNTTYYIDGRIQNIEELISIPNNALSDLTICFDSDEAFSSVRLRISELLTIERCTFYFPDNVSLDIEANTIIENSAFYACDNQWLGIANRSTELLDISHSEINNALNGVSAHQDAPVRIVGVEFNQCNSGIRLTRHVNKGMRGNSFDGCDNGFRINNTFFQYPTTDSNMFISGPESMSLDNQTTIINGVNGFNIDSDFECRLSGLIINDMTGCAIMSSADILSISWFEISSVLRAVLIEDESLAFFARDNVNVINASRGGFEIRTQPVILDIANTDFVNTRVPIKIDDGPTFPFFAQIINNTFTNSRVYTMNFTEAENIFISDNMLTDNPRVAVNMELCRGLNIFDNKRIELDERLETAIHSMGGFSNTYRQNVIIGMDDRQTGISLEDQAPFICDNDFILLETGLELDGAGQFNNGTIIQLNNFEDNEVGLYVSGVEIGEQFHHENEWNKEGASSTTAKIDPGLELGSRFLYHPINERFVPDNHRTNSIWFLDDVAVEPGELDCDRDDPNFTSSEEELDCFDTLDSFTANCCDRIPTITCEEILELFGPAQGITSLTQAQLWQLQQQVVDWWLTLDNICGVGPLPDDLLDCWDNFNSTEGEGGSAIPNDYAALIAQGSVIHSLHQANKLSMSQNLELKEIASVVMEKISSLEGLDGDADMEEILSINQIIAENLDLYNSIMIQHQADKLDDYDKLQTQIDDLSSPYEFTKHQNNILEIQTKLLMTEIENLNELEIQKVIAAANACPYEVGQLCYVARSYYHKMGGPHPSNYDNESLCNRLERRSREVDHVSDIYDIYPNPLMQTLFIRHVGQESDSKKVDIIITDLMGSHIWTSTNQVIDNTFSIELADIEPGVYFITILSEGQSVFTEKILKLNSQED